MAPMKLAIIGGGPSAFYVASRLLSLIPQSASGTPPLRIHMFDRLWAPHGLVRYGVAPDHPEVKASRNCTHKFDGAAADNRFRFFGNVNIGEAHTPIPHTVQVPLSALYTNYTHIVFATGCTLPTLHPALPPSEYCMPALDLVHWYTQHPSCPSPPPLERITHVSLIGNGNVSLDIARMLLTPVSVLEKYDVPAPVLAVLARSQVKHVSIFGRRGPLEAAFTTKELRELVHLPDSSMVPLSPALLDPSPPSNTANPRPAPTRQQSRILKLLREGSTNPFGSTPKTWSLDFFRSPTRLALPSPSSEMAELTLAHTALDPTHTRAIPTGATSKVSTSLVVTSLGFHAEPHAPFHDPALLHMRTTPGGRVVAPPSSSGGGGGHGHGLKNIYASGWAATGARGVLAATMMDAYAVADAILSDWLRPQIPGGEEVHTTPPLPLPPTPENANAAPDNEPLENAKELLSTSQDLDLEALPREVEAGLREGVVVGYGEWKRVDGEEVRRGAVVGKERERMGWEEARAFLDGSR